MRFPSLFLLICLVLLVGCNSKSSDPDTASPKTASPKTASTGNESSETDNSGNNVSTAKKSEVIGDNTAKNVESEWLAFPEDIDERAADPYAELVKLATDGDANAAVQLAYMSQQIASMQMRSGENEEAYQFFIQAGKAMRLSIEGEAVETMPQSMIGQIFYNEACGLAKTGKVDAAMLALGDSIQNGFHDMDLLKSDEDLAKVRALDGFDESLVEWTKLAAEKLKEHAREELKNGETFPFTFAATDVNDKEQSLDALKGKVVIVDVWGTWCPPCRAEIPSFIKLQEKYGEDGFQMIGLNYEGGDSAEEDKELILEFMQEFDMNYPCIVGDKETKDQIPDFGGYPTTLFIDKTGKVRMKAVGLHEYAFLDAIVSELLSE